MSFLNEYKDWTGIVFEDPDAIVQKAIESATSGGDGKTPKAKPEPRILEEFSPTQLRYLWRAGRIAEDEWRSELMQRGESYSSAVAEIAKAKATGISTATRTRGQLTAEEAAAVRSLAGPPINANPGLSQSLYGGAFEDAEPPPLGTGGQTPPAVSQAASDGGGAVAKSTATSAAQDMIARFGPLIKDVKYDEKGNITSISFYDAASQKAIDLKWDSAKGWVPSATKPYTLTEKGVNVTPAQRALTSSSRNLTEDVPLGGPAGMTRNRPPLAQTVAQGGQPLPIFDEPYIPYGGYKGQAQQDYLRNLPVRGGGYVPFNINPVTLSQEFLGAGANAGAGLGIARYDPSILGNFYTPKTFTKAQGGGAGFVDTGKTVLDQPSSARDALQSALAMQTVNAQKQQLGYQPGQSQDIWAALATLQGLMSPEDFNRWLTQGTGNQPSQGGYAAPQNVTSMTKGINPDTSVTPPQFEDPYLYNLGANVGLYSQGYVPLEYRIPGATYDQYGRITYDPSTDTGTGYSGAPPDISAWQNPELGLTGASGPPPPGPQYNAGVVTDPNTGQTYSQAYYDMYKPFANGGSMMLDEPTWGIGALTGDRKFLAGEGGRPERVSFQPQPDGLNSFEPWQGGVQLPQRYRPQISTMPLPAPSRPLPAQANQMAQTRYGGQMGLQQRNQPVAPPLPPPRSPVTTRPRLEEYTRMMGRYKPMLALQK